VFGRSVADISLNAVANLGYADCVFGTPVYPGDTLTAESRVLGLRQTASGTTGVVWLRSIGTNQRGETVLDYVRWVMVNKRDPAAPAPEPVTPDLPEAVEPARLTLPEGLSLVGYDADLAGSADLYDDYRVGERIDHLDGMTLEDAEHQMATRLYQNNARVHFNLHAARDSRFGRRVVYGGHIISLARALSFNGLANAFRIAAINQPQLRRGHHLRLVRGARENRLAGALRCGRAATAQHRHQGQALRRVPTRRPGRQAGPRRRARPRLHRAHAPALDWWTH